MRFRCTRCCDCGEIFENDDWHVCPCGVLEVRDEGMPVAEALDDQPQQSVE